MHKCMTGLCLKCMVDEIYEIIEDLKSDNHNLALENMELKKGMDKKIKKITKGTEKLVKSEKSLLKADKKRDKIVDKAKKIVKKKTK